VILGPRLSTGRRDVQFFDTAKDQMFGISNIRRLVRSIGAHGFNVPILVDRKLRITEAGCL
jgi:hypothetical protein